MNFFIGIFLKVLFLPSTTVVKTRSWRGTFKVFLILHFQSLGTMTQFLFKSRLGNETWLKKLTEVSNYDKFICNIFGWDTVKIGIIRAKVDLRICVCRGRNRAKPKFELNITFNQYSRRSFQKVLVGINNLWIQLGFKACVRFFLKIFIFSPYDSPSELWKMLFISSKKLFSFSRYSIFCICLPLFSYLSAIALEDDWR